MRPDHITLDTSEDNMKTSVSILVDELIAEITRAVESGNTLPDPGKGLCAKTPGKLTIKAGTLSGRRDLAAGYTRETAIKVASEVLANGKVSARNEIARGDEAALQVAHNSSKMSEESRADRTIAIQHVSRLLSGDERALAIKAFAVTVASVTENTDSIPAETMSEVETAKARQAEQEELTTV